MKIFLLFIVLSVTKTLCAQNNYIPNRILFKIKAEHSNKADNILSVLQKLQPKNLQKILPDNSLLNNIYVFDYEADISIFNAVEFIKKELPIEWAEPDYLFPLLYNPNDPRIGSQPFINKINLIDAWDISKGSRDISIAIIDGGIEFNHPDLRANLKINVLDTSMNNFDDDGNGYDDDGYGFDFVGVNQNNPVWDPDPLPLSPCNASLSHGTMITGLAAAVTDNGEGGAGAGFNSTFIPIKATSDSNSTIVLSAALKGFEYAKKRKANIILCAWGSTTNSFALRDIVNKITFNEGILIVAAAGNTNGEVYIYPAAYPEVLSVTALSNDFLFSGTLTNNCEVDIAVPTSSLSTHCDLNYYSPTEFPTSQACAIVAGVCALIKATFPSYTPSQIEQKIRISADDIFNIPSNRPYKGKIGNGSLNAFKALTVNNLPAIRYVSATPITTPQIGQNFILNLQLKNYLFNSAALQYKFKSDDPDAQQVNPNDWSIPISLSTLQENQVNIDIQVFITATKNKIIRGYIQFRDTTLSYADQQCYSFVVDPTYSKIGVGQVSTTINSVGNFGCDTRFGFNRQGIGFEYIDENYIREGGFLIGRNKTQVVDNILKRVEIPMRPVVFNPDSDFIATSNIQIIAPGAKADQESFTQFNDNGANSDEKMNVSIKQHTYSNKNSPDSLYVIFEYTIKNLGDILLDSVHIGLYADWEIGNTTNNDTANYYAPLCLSYGYGDDDPAQNKHLGMMLLTDTNKANAAHYNQYQFHYSDSAKFKALSNKIPASPLNNANIIQFLSAGPLIISASDSIKIAFALIAANSYSELLQTAQVANQKYQCLSAPPQLFLELGPNLKACNSITLNATTFGATTYKWSTGQTTPIVTFTESKNPSLTIYDSKNCPVTDQIQLTILPKPQPKPFFYPTQLITIADTLYMTDSSTDAISFSWQFGDGFGAEIKNTKYQYKSPGIYTVTLTTSNDICSTSVQRTIIVSDTNVSNDIFQNTQNELIVFPNPTSKTIQFHFNSNPNEVNELTLTDLQGKIHIATDAIPLRDDIAKLPHSLPSGLYFLTLKTPQKTYHKKIIVSDN